MYHRKPTEIATSELTQMLTGRWKRHEPDPSDITFKPDGTWSCVFHPTSLIAKASHAVHGYRVLGHWTFCRGRPDPTTAACALVNVAGFLRKDLVIPKATSQGRFLRLVPEELPDSLFARLPGMKDASAFLLRLTLLFLTDGYYCIHDVSASQLGVIPPFCAKPTWWTRLN